MRGRRGFWKISPENIRGTGIAKFSSEIFDSLAEFLRVCGLFTKNKTNKQTI